MKVKHVRLRTKGRKWPIITLVFYDGRTKSFTPRTDPDLAEEIVKNIRHQVALGTFVITDYIPDLVAPSIKLSLFKEKYKKHREKEKDLHTISPNTYRLDQDTLSILIKAIGDQELQKINESKIDEFIIYLKSTPTKRNDCYTPASINIYLNTLQSAFSWAQIKRMVSSNPFYNYPRQKTKKKTRRYLSEDEIIQLREYFATKNEWYLDAFNLTIWTGMRTQGILSLNIKNHYKKNIDGRDIWFIRITEKGDKDRPIPLTDKANEIISKRISWLKDEKLKYRAIANTAAERIYPRCVDRANRGYLFFEIINRNAITHAFSKARKDIHIPDDITWHSLRHSFATYYLENGGSIEALKEILGHENIKTTEVYAEITLKKMANKINEYANI